MRSARTCRLNDLFWERVAEILAEQGKTYADLWATVIRDKNTYTSWRRKRTLPKISDVEEIAHALNVNPADLIRPSDGHPTKPLAEQLELPLTPGSKAVAVELAYTPIGFVVRPALKRAG